MKNFLFKTNALTAFSLGIALASTVFFTNAGAVYADGQWFISGINTPPSGTSYPCPSGSYNSFTNGDGTDPEQTCASNSQGNSSSAVSESESVSWFIQWGNSDGHTPNPDRSYDFDTANEIGGAVAPAGTSAASAGASAGDEGQAATSSPFNKSDAPSYDENSAHQFTATVGASTSASPDWSGDPQHENTPISTSASAQGSMSVYVSNTSDWLSA